MTMTTDAHSVFLVIQFIFDIRVREQDKYLQLSTLHQKVI